MDAGALGRRVIFADEKIFRAGHEAYEESQNFRAWVDKAARRKDARQDDIARGRKQGGVSATCALRARHAGAGTLAFIEKGVKIDKNAYLGMAQDMYYPDIRLLIGDDPAFTQDGASPRAAQAATEYLGNNFEVLEPWPANSPGLNALDYTI